ncbi:hypothetical protein Ddc_15877 [Ditylenchus destructor]|nr:hypothetical protein Ddc_15877 [Ditylenchus destructor]
MVERAKNALCATLEIVRADLHLECVVQVIKGEEQDQKLPVTLTQVSVEQKFIHNYSKDRKVFVDRTFKPYIRHLENVVPGSFTGDHLPNMAQHGWRNVSHIELDKALACGPTKPISIWNASSRSSKERSR